MRGILTCSQHNDIVLGGDFVHGEEGEDGLNEQKNWRNSGKGGEEWSEVGCLSYALVSLFLARLDARSEHGRYPRNLTQTGVEFAILGCKAQPQATTDMLRERRDAALNDHNSLEIRQLP